MDIAEELTELNRAVGNIGHLFTDTRVAECRNFDCKENLEGQCNLKKIFIMDGQKCRHYEKDKNQ